MKITFERNKEQIELIKAMASADKQKAYEAQNALAAFVAPVIATAIDTAPTLSAVFQTETYNMDDNPSIPVDLYYDVTDEDAIKVYSQSMPGGLPSNSIVPTASELKVATYTLDSAYNFDKKYAAKSRLDVVAKTFGRLAQEVMLKQERTSANLILGTLADNAANQVVTAGSSRLLPDDFNKLLIRAKRVNTSWTKGTPNQAVGAVTDLWLSPERMGDIRQMAYNPINTKAANNITATNASPAVVAPEDMRRAMFSGAGLREFYGLTLHEINEFGKAQRYTNIYGALEGGSFDEATDDIVLGLDLASGGLIRLVASDPATNNTLSLEVDDQFVARQRKIGYYMHMEEGRVIIDKRRIFGLRVDDVG